MFTNMRCDQLLNKITFDSDTLNLDDIFKKLEINDSGCSMEPASERYPEKSQPNDYPPSPDSNIKPKKGNCDRGTTLALGVKMSKIATLLPNKGTIKGTFKNAKRKHLFPKKQNKETPNSAE